MLASRMLRRRSLFILLQSYASPSRRSLTLKTSNKRQLFHDSISSQPNSSFFHVQELINRVLYFKSIRRVSSQLPALDSKETAENAPQTSNLPTKEQLFYVDWILETLVPGFMKKPVRPLMELTADDVVFEDKIFKYNFRGRSQLMSHIAKVRAYYRYLSPYNKVERLGSCVYDGEDVVVVLWRLSTLKSSLLSYLKLPGTKENMNTVEGALDFSVRAGGKIYKIVNREIMPSDLEGAKVMSEMKKEAEIKRKKEEQRKLRKELQRSYEELTVYRGIKEKAKQSWKGESKSK